MCQAFTVDKFVMCNLEEFIDNITRYNTEDDPYIFDKEKLLYFWFPHMVDDASLYHRAKYILALSEVQTVERNAYDVNGRETKIFETGRHVLGAICLEDIEDESGMAYTNLIAVDVHPNAREQGIASKLVQYMIQLRPFQNNQLSRSSPAETCPSRFTQVMTRMLNEAGVHWCQMVDGVVHANGNPSQLMIDALN